MRRHREQCDDPEGDPGRHAVHVHPEADPGDGHDEDGGQVALDQVEADRTVQVELGREAAVVA